MLVWVHERARVCACVFGFVCAESNIHSSLFLLLLVVFDVVPWMPCLRLFSIQLKSRTFIRNVWNMHTRSHGITSDESAEWAVILHDKNLPARSAIDSAALFLFIVSLECIKEARTWWVVSVCLSVLNDDPIRSSTKRAACARPHIGCGVGSVLVRVSLLSIEMDRFVESVAGKSPARTHHAKSGELLILFSHTVLAQYFQ